MAVDHPGIAVPARPLFPPALRQWWSGLPTAALAETGALRLPGLLPLREKDRLLFIGPHAPGLAALLASRVALATPPVAVVDTAVAGGWRPAAPGERVLCAAPQDLPFPDRQFTVVVLPHLLHARADPAAQAVLTECWRVLTHNGVVVLWDVARSRSAGVNAVWRRLLGADAHLRGFAEIGRMSRAAGFAWIQTLPLQPFLWPPGPRVAMLLRKEYYDADTLDLPPGTIPD